MFHFRTSYTFGFLTFSEGIEMEHWREMGQSSFSIFNVDHSSSSNL